MKLSSNDFSKLLGGTGGGCCAPFAAFPLVSALELMNNFPALPLTRGMLSFVVVVAGDDGELSGTCRMSGMSCCARYALISLWKK